MKRSFVILGFVLVIGAIVLSLATGWPLPLENRLTVVYAVPDAYAGYLVTRWACPNGMQIPRGLFDRWQETTIAFQTDGTSCVADSIPRAGLAVDGYYFGNGERAPVIGGGTRAVTGNATPPAYEFVFTYASIGIGNGQILGNECTWRDFINDRFGADQSPVYCRPIYVVRDPSVPLTPGAKAGP